MANSSKHSFEQNPSFPVGKEFWRYEEISPTFAEIIRTYGEKHRDFMTHEKMIAAFMEHPEGQRILNRPHDDRSNEYWVGVMKAHFSRKYNSGRSEWDDCFEPNLIDGEYAYRVRRKETSPPKRKPVASERRSRPSSRNSERPTPANREPRN